MYIGDMRQHTAQVGIPVKSWALTKASEAARAMAEKVNFMVTKLEKKRRNSQQMAGKRSRISKNIQRATRESKQQRWTLNCTVDGGVCGGRGESASEHRFEGTIEAVHIKSGQAPLVSAGSLRNLTHGAR